MSTLNSLSKQFFGNVRPGSLKILSAPSRFGNKLSYPRGIYEQVREDQANASAREKPKRNSRKA